MDYRAFTNDNLTLMYESVRGALASDDAQKATGEVPRFRVRETTYWKQHAGNRESKDAGPRQTGACVQAGEMNFTSAALGPQPMLLRYPPTVIALVEQHSL